MTLEKLSLSIIVTLMLVIMIILEKKNKQTSHVKIIVDKSLKFIEIAYQNDSHTSILFSLQL